MKHLRIRLLSIWASFGLLLFGLILFDEAMALSRVVDVDELLENSQLVLSGTYVRKSMYREPISVDTISSDGKGGVVKGVETINGILTDYEIEISSVIKGVYEEPVIQLTSQGGTVGNESFRTSGTLRLTEGDEYYFFLSYDPRNSKWWVVASHQGVFEEVQENGKTYIRSLNKQTLVEAGGNFQSGKNNSDKKKMEIEEFISRVKAKND